MRAVAVLVLFAAVAALCGSAGVSASALDAVSASGRIKQLSAARRMARVASGAAAEHLSASERAYERSHVLAPTYFATAAGSETRDVTRPGGLQRCDWQLMDKELANLQVAGNADVKVTDKKGSDFQSQCAALMGSFTDQTTDVFVDHKNAKRSLKQHIEWAPLRALCLYTLALYEQWNPPLWDNTAAKPLKSGTEAPAQAVHTHFGALTVCAAHGLFALRRAQYSYFNAAGAAGHIARDFPDVKVDGASVERIVDPVLLHGFTQWSKPAVGGKYVDSLKPGTGNHVVTEKAFFSSTRLLDTAASFGKDKATANVANVENDAGVVVFLGDNTAWVAPWSQKAAEDEYLSPPGTEFVVLDLIPLAKADAHMCAAVPGAKKVHFNANVVLAVERRRFERIAAALKAGVPAPLAVEQSVFDMPFGGVTELVKAKPPSGAVPVSTHNAALTLAHTAAAIAKAGEKYEDMKTPDNAKVQAVLAAVMPRFQKAVCHGDGVSQRSDASGWKGDNGAYKPEAELARPEHQESQLSVYLQNIAELK